MKYLYILSGKNQGGRVDLPEGDYEIGRKKDCALPIEDEKASGKHCLLSIRGKHITVKDLGSSNGTYVNGRVITEIEMHVGDRLVIGTTVFELRKD